MKIAGSISIAVALLGAPLFSQTAPAKAANAALQTDREASEMLKAAEKQITALPDEQRQSFLLKFDPVLKQLSPSLSSESASALMNTNTSNLSLQQKTDVLDAIQSTQQLVEPKLLVTPSNTVNAIAMLTAFRVTKQPTPTQVLVISKNAEKLQALSSSIGRLITLSPQGTRWYSQGTVFVTKQNIVATACHVAETIGDVKGNEIRVNPEIKAMVYFSDAPLEATKTPPPGALPVTKILGKGMREGCDVAFLEIEGGERIQPLTMALDSSRTMFVALIGYPLLQDLDTGKCSLPADSTVAYFCLFHKSNPVSARVISPGTVLLSSTHSGVDYIAYNSTTRMGQSGSPVIDMETLLVVGVHYCCTGTPIQITSLGCSNAHPQKLTWNEAVTTSNILSDKLISPFVQSASTGERTPAVVASAAVQAKEQRLSPQPLK